MFRALIIWLLFCSSITLANNLVLDLDSHPEYLEQNKLAELLGQTERYQFEVKRLFIKTRELYGCKELIRELHRADIEVYLTIADSVRLTDYRFFERRAERLLEYNKKVSERFRFDGIYLELRPYIHPNWGSNPERLLSAYAGILNQLRLLLRRGHSSLKLGAELPYSFKLNGFAGETAEEILVNSLFKDLDFASLMPLTIDPLELQQNLQHFAKKEPPKGCDLYLNIVTDSELEPNLTYRGYPLADFNLLLDNLNRELDYPKNLKEFTITDGTIFEEAESSLSRSHEGQQIVAGGQPLELTISVNSSSLATCYLKVSSGNLIITTKVADSQYISTSKSYRDQIITDDHLEFWLIEAKELGHNLHHPNLRFKLAPGSEDYPPTMVLLIPEIADLGQKWSLKSLRGSDGYRVTLTIPLAELILDSGKGSHFRFNYLVYNTDIEGIRLQQKQALHNSDTTELPLLTIKNPVNY